MFDKLRLGRKEWSRVSGIALLLAALSAPSARASCTGPQLLITEFQAANDRTLTDEDGEHSDWIEIYNPCTPVVSLSGWHLTDDPLSLSKWTFPASASLARGEFLVVFASGKNRTAGAELHTNFKLDADGEYLALVRPDGTTVEQAFSPEYPSQIPDVSYGLAQSSTTLLSAGATASWHVPGAADAGLGDSWTQPGFDATAWSTGPTGLGFVGPSASVFQVTNYKANIAVPDMQTAEAVTNDPATQSSVVHATPSKINYLNTGGGAHFASDLPFPGTTIGTDVNDFVVLVTGTILIPTAGPWTFGVNSDDGYTLELSRQPYVFNSSFPGQRGPGDTFATFNIVDPGAYSVRLLFYERGGGSELEFFAAAGSFSSFNSNFKLVGDTASGGLAVVGIGSTIATNLQSAMENVNASVWTRLPFQVVDPGALSTLTLKMRYEDGFVAYLNGSEVARRNAPAAVTWDSAAASDRPIESALFSERIDLTDYLGLLSAGTNVLAVQGLNDAASNGDFLILPELEAVSDPGNPAFPRFFTDVTAGGYNGAGYPGVSGSPEFSRATGTFTTSFSLTLSAAPGASIRYTLDGSEPTASHGTLYTASLSITTSVPVRARVFEPGLAPGPVLTRQYARLASDVQGFTSNLPIVVVDTFGYGLTENFLTPALISLIEAPAGGGRTSTLDAPSFAGSSGIRLRGSSSLSFPKKQFALEIWDEFGKDRSVSFLGLPTESDWILYAPYSEKALMQNVLAYKWSRDIGRYAVRTRWAEMYLKTGTGDITSADYWGIYVVMEKIKTGPDRVAIQELLPSDNALPELSGGYVLKKDRLDPGDSGLSTSLGTSLAYVDPKENEITPEQAAYIRGYLDQFEAALYGPGFADPTTGYAAYIDVGSFIDHQILVELLKNIDGYRLSTFMFKNRGGKLSMGPIWDYNLSLGNANYLEGWIPTGWYHDQIGGTQIYPWYTRLFQDPEFQMRYADRWYELRRGPFATAALVADINNTQTYLDEAQARNFVRWPILGTYVWPNYFIGPSYASEVDWMRQFLLDRLAWIDSQLPAPPSYNQQGGTVATGFHLTVTAPSGTIYYTTDGGDPRLPGGGIAPSASVYAGDIVITSPVRVRARTLAGAVWSAQNDATFEPVPISYVNEVLPVNVAVNSDETGGFDPWIELYNPSPATANLGGLFLTNNLSIPNQWAIPAGTRLCGYGRLLVWADNSPGQGPLHTNFTLSASGGTVGLFDASGVLISSLTYPALASNTSYGRLPDGSGTFASFLYPTPAAANTATTTALVVNEYNGALPTRLLANNGTDTFWGRILGNGGDWIELVVVKDHLDLRGWRLIVRDNVGSPSVTSTTLTFTNHAALSDLRSGTILTVAEELASDVSYNPGAGDWWMNFRSGPSGDGTYISALDFTVSQNNSQITVQDASGRTLFGPAGEGVVPASGIGNDEIWKLEADPGPATTAYSSYNDGTTSTFGSPNAWNSGASHQDLSALRSVVSHSCTTAADCVDGDPCTDDLCTAGTCSNAPNTAPCDDGDACTSNDVCANRVCGGAPIAGCCQSDCQCNDGLVCTTDVCVNHLCQHPPALAGTPCNDADACTTGDVCAGGVCGGQPLSCSDGNPCTDDGCASGVCTHASNTAPCDDGDACTVNDACAMGSCAGGAPRDCGDGSICTSDSCAQGLCAHAPSGLCSISGTVRYYRDNVAGGSEPSTKPVSGVPLDATQDAVPDAVSSAAGDYTIANQAGSLVVRTLGKYGAPRASDHNGAITSFDAVTIARAAVGDLVLSDNQRIAADVTGNGQVTSFDASRVAQFAVQIIDHFDAAVAAGSDWAFARCDTYESASVEDCGPPEYAHDPLLQSGTDDFYAILYGDVTGNWQPAATLSALSSARSPGDPSEEALAAERDARLASALRERGTASRKPAGARRTPAVLSIPAGARPMAPGEIRTLQVELARADGIQGLDLELRWDPAALALVDVAPAGLASDFTLARRTGEGSLRAVLFGVDPMEGSGTILRVTVRALEAMQEAPLLKLHGVANEGQIRVVTSSSRPRARR